MNSSGRALRGFSVVGFTVVVVAAAAAEALVVTDVLAGGAVVNFASLIFN